MDNLTHSLVGALLGQAGLKRKTGLAMPALIIGANLPDVDAACFFWLDGVEHLAFRRGITHGPIAWVLLPLVLAVLLYGYDRWQTSCGKRPGGRLPVHFGWLYVLSFIACLSHPALDWLNSYGIRLLEPFSSQWFYGDTLFIIDIWVWLGMGFATWFSLRREKRGGDWRKPARIALTIASGYVLANGLITRAAERSVTNDHPHTSFVIANPSPFQPWNRELIFLDQNKVSGAGPLWETRDWGIFKGAGADRYLSRLECLGIHEHYETNRDQEAFLFWSRAPLFERAPDGSVLLRDARFYDPRARDSFTVALPEVKCEPIR